MEPRTAIQPLRILLAEDNPHNQRVVELMLVKDNHSVTIVNNGREAYATWDRQRFDLILMDVQMPEMDGYQATAAIRAAESDKGCHIPIVALTAFARKEDQERCLAVGMDAYVRKPVNAADLRNAIEECLSARVSPIEPPDNIAPGSAWDLDAALERVDGDLTFLKKMTSTLLAQLPEQIGELRQAIEASEPDAIRAPAHTLKNWFGNFFATRAAEMTRELEDFGHQGDIAGARALLGELELETERLVHTLECFATTQHN
jgi:CheY-like chemotaxis protein/HPt (histidine-containing phosphotransfer) domain-containing protein